MAQQQTNYYPQTASQHAGDQQWGDNSGAVINNYNNVRDINHIYYGGYAAMQGPVAAYTVQTGDPVRQAPGPAPPGFTHIGHGVQQPPFSGTNVQSHVAHVCGVGKGKGKAKGPYTAQEKEILHALCSSVVERSNHAWDCDYVGADVTRESLDHFIAGDEQLAHAKYWRRAQQTDYQRRVRAEKKRQKDLAKQPDLSQQWSANTPVYHQQMQVVDDNARLLHPNVDMDFNAMLLDQNAEGHVEIQMQQEAQQDLLPQDWAQLALDTPVDPQLAL